MKNAPREDDYNDSNWSDDSNEIDG